MKITRRELKRIIKEELKQVLEQRYKETLPPVPGDPAREDPSGRYSAVQPGYPAGNPRGYGRFGQWPIRGGHPAQSAEGFPETLPSEVFGVTLPIGDPLIVHSGELSGSLPIP